MNGWIKDRLRKWIDASQCMRFIEMTLLPDVQGIGRLDVELIKETERLKTKSKLQKRIRLKHLTLSKLWIFGAYELIRLIDEMTTKKKDLVSQKTKLKIKKTKREFEKIRIPLTKLEMPRKQFKVLKKQNPKKQNRLFAQFPDSFLNLSGEVGWNVYTTIDRRPTETYYRRRFGNILLKLFEVINKDIRAKHYNARI